jgi:hypothetical protein
MYISEEDYAENRREASKFFISHDMKVSIVKFILLVLGLIVLRILLSL